MTAWWRNNLIAAASLAILEMTACGKTGESNATSDARAPSKVSAPSQSGGQPVAKDAGGLSFAADVQPIFFAKCVACHVDQNGPGNMGLAPQTAYRQIVSVRAQGGPGFRVKPGSPDESYLYLKVAGTHLDHGGTGTRMPMGGAPLTDKELAKIRDWIAAGARNN